LGYIETILEPDERAMYHAKKHWIVYSGAFLLLLFGVCFLLFTDGGGLGFLLLLAAVVAFIRALIIIRTAEIAVTTRRLINKRGLIRRDTVEINASKIESIDLRQSILGRALDYGTVIVRGTRGMGSLMRDVEEPLLLRRAVQELSELSRTAPHASHPQPWDKYRGQK